MTTQPCNLNDDELRTLLFNIENVVRLPDMRQILGPMLYDSLLKNHEALRHHLYKTGELK